MINFSQFISNVETVFFQYVIYVSVLIIVLLGILFYFVKTIKQDIQAPTEKTPKEIRMPLCENFEMLPKRHNEEI